MEYIKIILSDQGIVNFVMPLIIIGLLLVPFFWLLYKLLMMIKDYFQYLKIRLRYAKIKPTTNQGYLYVNPIKAVVPRGNKIQEKQSTKAPELEEYAGYGQSGPVYRVKNNDKVLEGEIVGIEEPKGPWSQAVVEEKMGYIAERGGLDSNNRNYWQTAKNAQPMGQGRETGRGR